MSTSFSFVKAKARGPVNYEPHEGQHGVIAEEHKKFRVDPIGCIGDHPRHIPYSSEKRAFQTKTGRDAFEAYHYTFKMPHESVDRDPHVVMWDYNVGLVRITAFFKSLGHSKTMPSKVMSANPGLKEISHSITGGSIGAQGYWVPYEAARAIAATFCWEIRYVLTPVFGLDFPDACVRPDNAAFLCTSIDSKIIELCTASAHQSRTQSTEASCATTPNSPKLSTIEMLKGRQARTQDSESGYYTDTDRSVLGSPCSMSSKTEWVAVNVPSIRLNAGSIDGRRLPAQSPQRQDMTSDTTMARLVSKKRCRSPTEPPASKPGPTGLSVVPGTGSDKRRYYQTMSQEARAAYTLMQLHEADVALAERRRRIERRASH